MVEGVLHRVDKAVAQDPGLGSLVNGEGTLFLHEIGHDLEGTLVGLVVELAGLDPHLDGVHGVAHSHAAQASTPPRAVLDQERAVFNHHVFIF